MLVKHSGVIAVRAEKSYPGGKYVCILKINKDTEVMLAKESTEWMLLVVCHSFSDRGGHGGVL